MKNWLEHIKSVGTETIQNPEEAKRIRLTNLMSLTVFTTGTPFAVMFYFYGSHLSGLVLLIYILSFLSIFYMNKKGRIFSARVVMLSIMNVAVIHYALWYGEPSGLHRMLVPFSCIPFLVFDRKDYRFIVLFTSVSLIAFMLIDFFPFDPLIDLDPTSSSIIFYGITCIAWTWFILEMFYLSNQNHEAYSRLANQAKKQTLDIVNAQEQERKRIARDLHDSLGQLLSALKIRLEKAKRNNETPKQDTLNLIDNAVEEMRSLAYNLMPAALDKKGLKSALDELVDKLRNTVEFKIFFQIHGIDETLITKEYQYNIYRIIQEGLNNIIKHAGAKEVSLQLLKVEDKLTITIEDDGKGFDIKARMDGGIGIQNIAARTEWLDGTFRIDSGPEIGSTLIVEIPLKNLN